MYNSIATMCLKDSIDRNHSIIFTDLCPDGFVVHKKVMLLHEWHNDFLMGSCKKSLPEYGS